ncbi:MAG TPA: hypothetical protein VHB79_23200 [Polyangiaceae bacterium]|nr:hypothetical protein [Polyangiaceae bacterium]
MLNRNAVAGLCLVGLCAVGCTKETTSSKNIKTPGIAALIDVYADTDSTATVHVALKIAGSSSNAYVTLEGTDKLKATAEGVEETLEVVDTGIYEAKFKGVKEDTEFNVTLERPDDETASDNTGTLPPPYTLDDPMSNLSRKTDDLPLSWAPAESGDSMALDIDGDCIFHWSKNVSDTGMYTVAADTLDSTGGDKPETCDLTLEVDRNRKGSADGKFDPESYFKLHQRRSATFTSKP